MSRRSKYDEAFQKNAVGLVTSGRKAAEVARDLGLHVETLYLWVKKYGRLGTAATAGVPESKELLALLALRKENEVLRMERDILKKAVGIFTHPPR
jgi:transposase